MRETRGVLLVEDDPLIADVLVDVLADEGYVVRHVRNGQQALTVLESWQPGVIVLDLTTPVMDGWAFRAEQLQRPASLARIPVIVLTGTYLVDGQCEVLAAAAIMAKPFDLEDLLEIIARVCRECPNLVEHADI